MEAEVQAFITDIEYRSGYAKNTRLSYARDLKHFVSYLSGVMENQPQVKDISPQCVLAYLQNSFDNGTRPSTLQRRLAALRRFVLFLRQTGVLDANPINREEVSLGAVMDVHDRGTVETVCLNELEVTYLKSALAASQKPIALRDAAILALMLEFGMSVRTLVELDLSDLGLKGKGIITTSNQGEMTQLPLGSALEPLKVYTERGRRDLARSGRENALFVNQMGNRLSRQGLWQSLQKWGRKAGLEKKLSPRVLRNTAALQMVWAGKGFPEMQKKLGHNSILSTRALVRRLKASSTYKLERTTE